jgi:hypothetical protein
MMHQIFLICSRAKLIRTSFKAILPATFWLEIRTLNQCIDLDDTNKTYESWLVNLLTAHYNATLTVVVLSTKRV